MPSVTFSPLGEFTEDQHHIRRTRTTLIAGLPRRGSLAHTIETLWRENDAKVDLAGNSLKPRKRDTGADRASDQVQTQEYF